MDPRRYRADERLNELSDRDELWGPLLFLRPTTDRSISDGRALVLSGLVGGFYGMLANVLVSLLLASGPAGKPSVWLMPVLFSAMFFLCLRLSLVAAWNRRARLTSRRQGWVELTRRAPTSRDDQHVA